MANTERVKDLYVKQDTLTTRMGLHHKYSVNQYGFGNWVFDQYSIAGNMKILELGCGTAVIWQNRDARIPQGVQITLSDFSPLMVEKARNLLQHNPVFSFTQVNIEEIPYDNDSFDIVIANHMLYHVPDKDKALAEVRRVLKPGGYFYATTAGEVSYQEITDIKRRFDDKANFSYPKNLSFTLESGTALLEKFFANIEQRHYIDALEVTDAGDLMEYIESDNEIPADIYDDFYRLICEGFVDGVFKIRKEQGIFVCSK